MDPAMKILTGSKNYVDIGGGDDGGGGGGEVDGGGGGEDQGTDKSDEDPFRFQAKSHHDKFPPPISV